LVFNLKTIQGDTMISAGIFGFTKFISILFIGSLLALFAALTDYYMVQYISDERKAEKDASQWPSVNGTVLSARLVSHGSIRYRADFPEISYSYEGGGKVYKSKHIAAGGEMGGVGAQSVLDRYPVASQVTVYYDPQKPKNAVLEKKSVTQKWLWVILIGVNILLCVAVPIYLTIVMFK
jgi:hypothetical protein